MAQAIQIGTFIFNQSLVQKWYGLLRAFSWLPFLIIKADFLLLLLFEQYLISEQFMLN